MSEFGYPEISRMIAAKPSLIVPVGALEPFGQLPLGELNRCVESVTDVVSAKLGVLVAPLLPFGNTIPFKSFEGCAALHERGSANIVYDLCKSWLFHGFQRIMVITFAMDGTRGIVDGVQRIGEPDKVRIFSLQDDPWFRNVCTEMSGLKERGRSEWGIMAIARHLGNNLNPEATNGNESGVTIDDKWFKRWHKCGRDPEKLRKHVANALFSCGKAVPGLEEGGKLYQLLLERILDEYTPFLVDEQ